MAKLTFMCLPEGKLPIGIAQILTARLKEFAGQKCTVELELAKDKRSNDANAYYWGVLVVAVRSFLLEQGQAKSVEDIHEDLLASYAPIVSRVGMDGKERFVPMRSSQMDKEQFQAYCLNIEVALADFGVVLPAHEKYKD